MNKSKRNLLLVDAKVQTPLLFRVTFYWLISLALMGLLIAIQVGYGSPSASLGLKLTRVLVAFGPALITSMLLLPLLLFDVVRYSNRFAGPMHRLRREFAKLADTGQAEQLDFREGDFWKELADQFNRIADRMERLEHAQQGSSLESVESGQPSAV